MKKKIGFKQVIQFSWIQKTIQLFLSGMRPKELREELQIYIQQQPLLQSDQERSQGSVSFAISMLSQTWIQPDKFILPIRQEVLECLRNSPKEEVIFHWIMLSLSYPFWFHVSRQVGKLFKFQDYFTQKQLVHRLKEVYGDRNTISRNARYALRTLVSWGMLKDSISQKGCYEKGLVLKPSEKTISLLFELSLITLEIDKKEYHQLFYEPAFYLFELDYLNSTSIEKLNSRLYVERFGVNQEFLALKNNKSI
ncbi:MAG: hypothetical protein H7A24_06175 [Leptospiraceae bacterium]|nr:hypothetical protein [Leptospiraceae bacterium]